MLVPNGRVNVSNPDPPKVDPKRQSDYDDMMLRLGVKNKLKEAVESGHSFKSACELVGIPYEYAFSASQTDDDFREIWQLSRSNGSLDTLPCPSTVWRDGYEVKTEFLNMLVEVGLFNKLVHMASLAEPGTTEGDKILMFFGRSIIPQVLPKQDQTDKDEVRLNQKSDKELVEMLRLLQRGRLSLDGE
jgi:hypothetical protein